MSDTLPKFFGENARHYVNNGYPVAPKEEGQKYPIQTEPWRRYMWQLPPDSQVAEWEENFAETGISMLCGRFIACFDIDEEDEGAAEQSRADVERICGPTPLIRIGRAPRLAMIYRAAEPIVSLRMPAHDVLGMGTTLVGLGIHPITHQPYRWDGPHTPANFKAEDLPAITNDQVAQVADSWSRRKFPVQSVNFRLEIENLVVAFGGSRTRLFKQLLYHLFRGRMKARERMRQEFLGSALHRNWGLVLVPDKPD